MASLLSELLGTLKGSREGVLPSARVFPRLDLDQLAAELRLEVRGKEDGQANQPAIDGGIQTAAESDVRAEVDRRAAKALEDYRVQLDLYEGRVRNALTLANLRTSIEAAGERALSDFDVQASEDINNLSRYHQEVDGRQREFDAFRITNRLDRLPHLDGGTTLRYLLIVLCVLLESMLNGMFFAQGSEAGIIGGVRQALVLSVFNVGLGFWCGRYVLGLLRHIRLTQRALGVALALVYVAFTTALNLGIGHFRELFVASAGDVNLTILLERLATNPAGLADVQSLLLVMLGIVFNITALISASGFDDPYPGYGAIGRRRGAAARTAADHTSNCVEDLRARRDEAIADMERVIYEVRQQEYDVQLAINGRTRLHAEYRAHIEHLGDCQLRLIQRYREANAKARGPAPAPERFKTAPASSFRPEQLPPLAGEVVDPEVMGHVIARMEYFIRAISKEYDAQVSRYFPTNTPSAGQRPPDSNG